MATKEELHEQVAELTMALERAQRGLRILRRKNRRLRHALEAESERFEQLAGYVESLRRWVEGKSSNEKEDGRDDADERP